MNDIIQQEKKFEYILSKGKTSVYTKLIKLKPKTPTRIKISIVSFPVRLIWIIDQLICRPNRETAYPIMDWSLHGEIKTNILEFEFRTSYTFKV